MRVELAAGAHHGLADVGAQHVPVQPDRPLQVRHRDGYVVEPPEAPPPLGVPGRGGGGGGEGLEGEEERRDGIDSFLQKLG